MNFKKYKGLIQGVFILTFKKTGFYFDFFLNQT